MLFLVEDTRIYEKYTKLTKNLENEEFQTLDNEAWIVTVQFPSTKMTRTAGKAKDMVGPWA